MAVSDNTLNLLNFRNCKRCNKPFSTVLSYTICPKCMDEEAKRFDRTRDYIYSNPGTTMEEVISKCNITTEELDRWIREEKIMLSDDSPISYPCESCGVRIKNGHFCIDCKMKLHAPTAKKDSAQSYSSAMHHFRKN